MNNQSPLIPQGILPEAKSQTRARVKIAVFVVLAVHGVGLLALLLQGCNKPAETTTAQNTQTNEVAPPAFTEPTNVPPPPSSTPPQQAMQPAPETPAAPPAMGTATDYKIVSGDNLSVLAKKFHVTVKAIEDANPGIEPTKLQIGQTIHIPPPTAPTAPTATAAMTAVTTSSPGEEVYTVKSGDTLTSIAHDKKTTLRALRSANSLTTDSIKVGQKLKIPIKPPTAPVVDSSTTASTTTSAPTGATPAH